MRPLCTRAQLRAFDERAVERGVPSLLLMENAGRGATDVLMQAHAGQGQRFLIVCGEGNNGGDGFVVARHLIARGQHVTVALHGAVDRLRPDARVNHDAYLGVGGQVWLASDASSLGALLERADVVVDAVFGTGLARPIEGATRALVDAMNDAPGAKVALDLPSGLDADTGQALGCVFRADLTIKFAHLVPGFLSDEGLRAAGEVHVVDIGVPPTLAGALDASSQLVETPDVAAWFTARDVVCNKYTAGSVAIFGGGPGKTGAASLAAEAALAAGAGLSTLVTWEESAPAAEARATEFMVARLSPDDLVASAAAALDRKRALAIGPGLGASALASRLVEHVVLSWDGPKVVDADAIAVFAGRASALAAAKGSVILTPHAGELARLLGVTSRDVEADRFSHVRRAARETGAVVLLKGARTLVAHGERVWANDTGTPALATAGAGDVLAGIITAFATSMSPVHAAIAGAHAHGLAAEAWRDANDGADRGLRAGELARFLPRVIARFTHVA